MPSVAVIDIGSNSIKVLIASCDATGGLRALKSRTIDARISAGISRASPALSEEGMARGLAAIQELLADAATFAPDQTILVATSAVRDARNGAEFRTRVHLATGHGIRILTGEEEADLIGLGLTCDPALSDWQNFYVFDLGGGSLECLSFRGRRNVQAMSLQLGCVRLTERFISDVNAPLATAEMAALAAHVRDELKHSGFQFSPTPVPAVFTGGTVTTVRALRATALGTQLEAISPVVMIETLSSLVAKLTPLTLEERKNIPGMPAARADVFPAALVTLLVVADCAQIHSFHHSLYNLRWGLAAQVLAALPPA
jgi:exopolyphosphatase/guanosine-5'-triphosphate,3'-diphosphate pyrophosphatase